MPACSTLVSAADGEAPTAIAHGGHVMAFAQSADGATTVFTKASIDHPARLYALGTDEAKQHRLDRTNAFLDKVPLGKWQSRTFKGWNDEPVRAFVCYPPNYDKKKKYPLLHSIHGGPHAAHMVGTTAGTCTRSPRRATSSRR